MIYCRKCGFVIPDDSVFCPKCGTPVAKPEEGKSTDRGSGRVEPGGPQINTNKT
ncbi:MAG TPA: zinc ribbon domain-containing protein [Bacteroidetes bacterium]|nr:zinc ribbon domain-containing protein [Bacteroidota bacterium]